MKTKKKDNTSDVNDRSILNNYLEQLDNEITWVNKNLLSKKNPNAEEKKAMYMIEELLKASVCLLFSSLIYFRPYPPRW